MLELIKRCPEYVEGYKEYCQEMYDNRVIYFTPTNPNSIDDEWFERTKTLYDKKEEGMLEGYPKGFHYWAIDNGKFIGEFQLRTEFSNDIILRRIEIHCNRSMCHCHIFSNSRRSLCNY